MENQSARGKKMKVGRLYAVRHKDAPDVLIIKRGTRAYVYDFKVEAKGVAKRLGEEYVVKPITCLEVE